MVSYEGNYLFGWKDMEKPNAMSQEKGSDYVVQCRNSCISGFWFLIAETTYRFA